MVSSPSILLYGHDARLLETRRWILEGCDFQVRTVSSLLALHETISTRQIDVMILCHSLSSEECERALDVAHLNSPGIKTLVLTAQDSICASAAGDDDAVLDTWEGPRVLLDTVQKLLCTSDAA